MSPGEPSLTVDDSAHKSLALEEALKAAAREYWLQGLAVIPMRLIFDLEKNKWSKKPAVQSWEQWQNRPQTLEEFESLDWQNVEAFAVLLGKTKSGFYLCCLDVDRQDFNLSMLRTTSFEKTIGGGIHAFYLSRIPAPGIKRHDSGLELLGEHNLVVVYPSRGYMKLNDNEPTVVENAQTIFYELMAKFDAELQPEAEKTVEAEGFTSELLSRWLSQIKQKLNVAGESTKYIYVHCPFHSPDRNPSFALHKTKFYAVDYHTGEVFTLKQLALKLGVELEGLKLEKNVLRLGGFKLQAVENDVFLFEASGRVRDCFKLSALTNMKTKERLSSITGLDREKLSYSIAEFLFRLKTWKDGEDVKQEEAVQVFDEETEARINAEVKKIIEADNQLEALKPFLDVVIVGEDDNKKAILVLEAGSKFKDLDKKQIIILKGMEGGGKTTLAASLTAPFKTKTVGRFTEHALEYSDLRGYELLYIKELGSMDLDKQGVASIKFLSCDDAGFIVEYTVKDESGTFRTEQKRIPAMTVISTTTRLLLDSQFERRAWLFNVDESELQTERVKKWKALLGQQKDDVKLGIRKITDYDFSNIVIKRFMAQLQPQKIIIPFRETLAEILTAKALRVRGDIDKLYTFIELYGLFNLKRLLKVKEDVYAVTPEIAIEALNIILKPLANMLGGADERVKPLIKALNEVSTVKGEYDEEGRKREVLETYTYAGACIGKEVREQLAVKLGKSEKTVRAYLSYLEEKGFVSSDNKKPKTYTLLYPLSEVEKRLLETSAISETADNLHDKLVKEAQDWLRTRLEIQPLQERKSFLKDQNVLAEEGGSRGKESERDKEEFSSSPQSRISNPVLDSFQADLTKRSLKNRQNEKLPISANLRKELPKWLIQCEFCDKQGKPMLFATQHDTKLHIKAFHNGCEAKNNE